MPSLTFACKLCSRRMAVGAELSGRPVRCPHCKQVVVAPPPDSPSAALRPDPATVTPPPPSDPHLPAFDLKPRERPESIFAEHAEEDTLFESAPAAKVQMPEDQPTDLIRKPPLPPPPPPPPAQLPVHTGGSL